MENHLGSPADPAHPLAGRRFAAVLFDMDGTLIDSTPAVSRSWQAWAQETGVAAPDLNVFHGQPAANVVSALVAEPQRAAALELIKEFELRDLDGVTPLPGALEAFAALPGGSVAIATSCTQPLAQARLGASGITPPEVLVTVDDVERGKPAPDPYLLAAIRLGVDPADCLVVEDAVSGITAARGAGCTVLALTTTTAPELIDADLVMADLSEIEWIFDEAGIGIELRG